MSRKIWSLYLGDFGIADDRIRENTSDVTPIDKNAPSSSRTAGSALGLEEIVTPKASPCCNGFAEHAIGTIRSECTDHIIP